jgi:hypothetical protein
MLTTNANAQRGGAGRSPHEVNLPSSSASELDGQEERRDEVGQVVRIDEPISVELGGGARADALRRIAPSTFNFGAPICASEGC